MVSTEVSGFEVAIDVGPASRTGDRDGAGALADGEALDRLHAHPRCVGMGERLRQGPVEDRTGPELPVVRATRLTAGDADMQADLLMG